MLQRIWIGLTITWTENLTESRRFQWNKSKILFQLEIFYLWRQLYQFSHKFVSNVILDLGLIKHFVHVIKIFSLFPRAMVEAHVMLCQMGIKTVLEIKSIVACFSPFSVFKCRYILQCWWINDSFCLLSWLGAWKIKMLYARWRCLLKQAKGFSGFESSKPSMSSDRKTSSSRWFLLARFKYFFCSILLPIYFLNL